MRRGFVDAKARADIPLPIYRVMFMGEVLFVEASPSEALLRVPEEYAGYSIEAVVDQKRWICWPPERATRPKEVQDD